MAFKLLTLLLALGALWLMLMRSGWFGGSGASRGDGGRRSAAPKPHPPTPSRTPSPAHKREPVDLIACERCGGYVPAGEECACRPEAEQGRENDPAPRSQAVLKS